MRCPVVVSAPGVFFWAGEHTVLDGAVAVVQQVPLRVFVGLEPLGPVRGTEPCLILDTGKPLTSRGLSHHVYRRDHLAEPCDFSAPQRETNLRKVAEVANLLFKDLCRVKGASTPIQRFRIRTASESRPGGGVNWSGAFSIALVTALLLTTVLARIFHECCAAARRGGRWAENGVAEARTAAPARSAPLPP